MMDNQIKAGGVAVDYTRVGDDIHHLALDSKVLADITIDYTGIPSKERENTAVKMLCAASVYCFASTTAAALTARGANIKSMTGRAVATKARDVFGRTKVDEVTVTIDVDIDDADLPILEKCKVILEHGCLLTYSVGQGIEMQHVIQRSLHKFPEESGRESPTVDG